MHDSPENMPLADFLGLDERTQGHVLAALQRQSCDNPKANVRFLFAEALQVVYSLSPATPASSHSRSGSSSAAVPASTPIIKSSEDTASSYLNSLILFNAAFEAMKDKGNTVSPEDMLDDYVFVRAVYTRLQRVIAGLALRTAEDVERDLRHFARHHKQTIPPTHFNSLMNAAFDAVPPPDDNYWAQVEHPHQVPLTTKTNPSKTHR